MAVVSSEEKFQNKRLIIAHHNLRCFSWMTATIRGDDPLVE
jgi:hypothetical protein